MSTITKTIFLTLVTVFLGSVGMAQTPAPASKPVDTGKEKLRLQNERDQAKSNLDTCKANPKNDCSKLNDTYNEKNKAYNEFEFSTSANKDECNSKVDAINEITKKFDTTAQQEALICMEAGTGDSPEDTLDLTGSVLRSLSGQREPKEDICSVDSAKSTQAEKLKEKLTALEKLERDLEKLEEKMIESDRKNNEKLADLNEDRVKLREDWEKKQSDQEEQQAKDVAAVRDNQIKLQEAIRKANSELIVARQEFAKAKRKRSEDLLKAGVQSFKSMERICKAQVKEYFSKAGYNAKKTSSGLAASSRSGGDKVSDVNSFYQDCLKSMNERRQAIYEDSSNYEVQMADSLKNRQEAIATLEGEYKQQSKSYNEALQRAGANMTKAQQAYLEMDGNLALKINRFQISSENERQTLERNKNNLLQKINAAELSNGKISEAEVTAGVNSMEKYMSLIDSLDGCPQASRFQSEKANFESYRKRIEDARANK